MFGRGQNTALTPQLLVNVGSGSVGVALVVPELLDSKKTDESPCVWSERISIDIKTGDKSDRQLAKLKATLLESFLAVNSKGRKILSKKGCSTKISHIHISLAAPWATTVPRRVTYSKKEPFELNDTLLEKLLDKSNQDVETGLTKEDSKATESLHLLESKVVQLELNGYPRPVTSELEPEVLTSFTFTHYTSFVVDSLHSSLMELIEDNFAAPTLSTEPFITTFNQATLRTATESSYCIFDITQEGTEIGIIRDKTLYSTSFLPIGTQTIAREIADSLKTTTDTAIHHLQDTSKATEKQAEVVQKVVKSYQDELYKKLSALPDGLAAPAIFYTHTSEELEKVLQTSIAAALLKATDNSITPQARSYTKLINENIPYACDSTLSLLCFTILQQFRDKDL